MTIYVLTGTDCYKKEQFLRSLKQKTEPFNIHHYQVDELAEALISATTPSFVGEGLIIISGDTLCNTSEEAIASLNPYKNTVVFNLISLDKRLKVAKLLREKSQIKEFELIPQWDTTSIIGQVKSRALTLGVTLPDIVANYIADAVGNNLGLMQSELEKLVACRGEEKLTLSQCKQLIPCLSQTSFELASALLSKDGTKVYQLALQLNRQGEHPLRIIGGIIYKFQLWLKIRAALDAGITDNHQLAKVAGVANQKQCFYLKKEVQGLSSSYLIQLNIKLFDLQCQIKKGMKAESLPTHLLTFINT